MKSSTLFYTSTTFVFLTACGGGGSSTSSPASVVEPTNSALTVPSTNSTVEAFAIPQNITLLENTSRAIVLQGVGSVFLIETQPLHGTLVGNVPALTYTPDKDYHGLDSFDFSVDGSELATISLTITEVNDYNISEGDLDNDFIPNNIELLLGLNPNDGDQNNNNIPDGLETEGSVGDAFFQYQWHLKSDGTFTNNSLVSTIDENDLDLLSVYQSYMGYNNGNNIIVQVVDTGVDADHPDLIDNMDLTRSLNAEVQGDPSANPSIGGFTHGTQVAGIMAARAFNTIGVRGIIPFAKIAGSNWLDTQSSEGLEKAWLMGPGANEIAVSNNSWGSYFDRDTTYDDLMALGTSTLRDGKGRVYVFAAGNDRERQGNANLTYTLSNRFAISVAGIKHDNTHAEYSSPGSNILVSAYSGNFADDSPTIGTTIVAGEATSDITWSEDDKRDYTFAMNGTSASSPMVAASVALVLEACPNLSWRDIKYLIAKHAKQVDSTNSSWVRNAVGLTHSIDYGFGLINAKGMITDCKSTYTNLSSELSVSASQIYNTLILDNTSRSFDISIPEAMTIEWVEVTIDNDSSWASDYEIELISPSGTKTILMTDESDVNQIGSSSWLLRGFRMSTAAMIGEQSIGIWKVILSDNFDEDEGTLKSIQIKVYGH